MKQADRKICVGMIASAHGVRGLVALRSFTENPEDVTAYGPLTDETGGKLFDVTLKSIAKNHFVAEVKGVATKEAADALRGVKLYVPRKALPKISKQEYYEADLIGLAVADASGTRLGRIQSVHDYGAGPFLNIKLDKAKDAEGKPVKEVMLPFTDTYVPEVDIDQELVTIAPPEGWL